MVRRGTLGVLAVFLLLSVAAWYLEWSPSGKTRARGTPAATTAPKVVSIDIDKIALFEFQDNRNEVIRIVRNPDNTWSLDKRKIAIDQGKIQQLLASFANLTTLSVMDNTVDLSAFGLVVPDTTITIQITGEDLKIIKIGKVTPTNSGYYVQVGNNSPVVVSKNSIDSIKGLINLDTLILTTPTPVLLIPGNEIVTGSPSLTPVR
jgi:hypothetical protein